MAYKKDITKGDIYQIIATVMSIGVSVFIAVVQINKKSEEQFDKIRSVIEKSTNIPNINICKLDESYITSDHKSSFFIKSIDYQTKHVQIVFNFEGQRKDIMLSLNETIPVEFYNLLLVNVNEKNKTAEIVVTTSNNH